MFTEKDLTKLVERIKSKRNKKWSSQNLFNTRPMNKDAEQQKYHAMCVELTKRGILKRHSAIDDMIRWELIENG